MIWHWRVSAGRLEPANANSDRGIVYVNKGDQLPLREPKNSGQPPIRSRCFGGILPPSRTGKPDSSDVCQN